MVSILMPSFLNCLAALLKDQIGSPTFNLAGFYVCISQLPMGRNAHEENSAKTDAAQADKTLLDLDSTVSVLVDRRCDQEKVSLPNQAPANQAQYCRPTLPTCEFSDSSTTRNSGFCGLLNSKKRSRPGLPCPSSL